MSTPIRTAAEVAHVREVTLLATAELRFWEERLRRDGLAPVVRDGRAQVLVIAAHLKYMGVKFRELSISILARRGSQEGAWMPIAFNTCRLFAYMERAAFATPYLAGEIRVGLASPSLIELSLDGLVTFAASMGSKREPASEKDSGWEGPVFLPWDGRGDEGDRKVFAAKISGRTRTFPFDAARDTVKIRPSPGRGIFQDLADSGLTGVEWAVREDARHLKSKTVKARELPAISEAP